MYDGTFVNSTNGCKLYEDGPFLRARDIQLLWGLWGSLMATATCIRSRGDTLAVPICADQMLRTDGACPLPQTGCGLMQLYDVGMTSMWVQEAFALAELAQVIGRPQALSDMLNARGKAMAQKISDNLWNEELGIFVNRFSSDHNNGTFYEHVSPTSFYALQAHAATDEQAAAMAENWLLNSSRFCVAPDGDYAGLKDSCYWGEAHFSYLTYQRV